MLSFYPPQVLSHPFPPESKATHVIPVTLPIPPSEPSSSPDPRDFELVIAHYNEDLDWLLPYSDHTIIYSKGELISPVRSASFAQVQTLPNIGRETHTYLTHIVRNYDRLALTTLFLQGNIHEVNNGTPAHTNKTLSQLIDLSTHLTDDSVLPIGKQFNFSDWSAVQYLPGWKRRRGATLVSSKFTPAQFWGYIFGEPHPPAVRFVQGALFGVKRQAIWRRPKVFYEKILTYFEELNERDPEEGHYMERFWYSVFWDGATEGPTGRVDELR